MGFLTPHHKTLEELQEEDENLSTEVSIAEKRALMRKLNDNGLSPKHFDFNWESIKQWWKTH